MSDDHRLRHGAAAAAGAVLAGLTRLVATRPAAKPLHPRGDLVAGQLRRDGAPTTGSPWLDQAGRDEVLVRRSRSVGFPEGWPDVLGVAIRVTLEGGGHGDLLLSTTGHGPLTRFLLAPGRHLVGRTLTTLLPYRTPSGPVVLGARPVDETRYVLAWAPLIGPWQPFGELTLGASTGPDPLVSFDPVRHSLPGLDTYGWVRRLREPSYATARRSRRVGGTD